MFDLSALGSITDLKNGRSYSSDELRQMIAVRHEKLLSVDISRQDKVIIAHGGTAYFFADLLALWSLGVCAVCVNPTLTEGELSNVSKFVDAKLILVDDKILDKNFEEALCEKMLNLNATAKERVLEDVAEDKVVHKVKSLGQLDLKSDDLALILFTSGTTGDPKGVMHTGESLSQRVSLNREYIESDFLDKSLCVLPTHFGHGLIGNCLTPLFSGAELFLYTTPSIAQLAKMGELIDENKITFLSSVPAFWKVVSKMSKPPIDKTLKQVNVGSAPLSAELWQGIINWSSCDNVNNMYGITESANWAAGASSRDLTPEDGLVGRMWGGEVAILSSKDEILAHGEGEILIKTPALMKGYYQRQDLTDQVFRDGWYLTGDFGEINEKGVVRITGRLKTEINHAGSKILPEEVDMLMEKHESISEACTFGVPDEISGERVAIAIRYESELLGKDLPDIEKIKLWCSERIRRECVPEFWYEVDEIPKTDRGKINRQKVKDYCLNLLK